jgi:hypothetical protein
MAMELFNKKGGKYSNPLVSITTAGQIGLNSACIEKFIKGRNHVLLYGDKENKTIGIKPIKDKQNNSFKISYATNANNTGAISGHSFLAYLGIDFKNNPGKYTPEWDDKNEMLIVKLNKEFPDEKE